MNPVKLDSTVPQQLLQIISKALPDGLNAGDILKGRVQSLDNGLLLLKLLDGALFTARVPEGFSASQGDLVVLEIGERLNDQLTARIISYEASKASQKPAAGQTLVDEIVQKLDNLGVAQSNRLASSVLELIKAQPGLSAEKAVFLASNSLKPSPDVLNIIGRISEHEFQLHENLHALKDGLLKAAKEGEPQAMRRLARPVMVSQALDELSESLNQILSDAPAKLKDTIIWNTRELLDKTLQNEMDGEAASGRFLDKKAVANLLNSILQSGENPNLEEINPDGLFKIKPQAMEKLLEAVGRALEDIHAKDKSLTGGDMKEFARVLEKLFDKAFIRAQAGSADQVDIREKIKALKEIMDFSKEVLSQADIKAREINLPTIKEIEGAFKFFSQVTAYDTLVQLPLKINQNDASGELYVMKRKNGRRKLDAGSFTLFLSLKTQNLGRIETFLNATRKCVTISFRVEEEELAKLVKNLHRALYDGLLRKGYKLAEMKCRLLDGESVGLFNAAKKTRELLGLESSLDLKI